MKKTYFSSRIFCASLIATILFFVIITITSAETFFINRSQLIVDLSEKDVSSLSDYFVQYRKNLISFDTDVIEIVAKTGQNYRYLTLYDSFTEGKSYLFALGESYAVNGILGGITVLVHDSNTKSTIAETTLRANTDDPQVWIFQIPENERAESMRLLLYAGEAKKTKNNTVDFKNIALYEWNWDGKEVQLLEKLPERTQEDKLSTEAWLNNPFNDITASTLKIENVEQNLIAVDSQSSIKVEAKGSQAYAYKAIARGLKAGQKYLLTVGSTVTRKGAPLEITIRVYDSENKKSILEKRIRADWDQQQAWSFTIPMSAASEDLRLLVYAGESGSTENNLIEIHDLGLYKR